MSDRRRTRPEASSTRRADQVRERKRVRARRIAAVAVAALVGFWIMRLAVGPDPNAVETVPPELLGTWVTSDPRYADRFLVIAEDYLELGSGPGESTVHAVRELRRTEGDGYVGYGFTYYTSAGDWDMEFRLHPDGTGRLKNPADVVWVRADP